MKTAPRVMPMPDPAHEARRAELIGQLAIPTPLSDPHFIRELLAEDFANRAAYIAWRDKLLADAAMYSRHGANCQAAAAAIDAALEAQKAVAV